MVASTGHKEHKSEVFGALLSHLSAEVVGLAGGPSLGAPKAKARRFHVVARSLVLDLSQISALEFCHRFSQQNTLHRKGGYVRNVASGLLLGKQLSRRGIVLGARGRPRVLVCEGAWPP